MSKSPNPKTEIPPPCWIDTVQATVTTRNGYVDQEEIAAVEVVKDILERVPVVKLALKSGAIFYADPDPALEQLGMEDMFNLGG